VNSNSLLGSGDVAVQPTLVSGTNIKTLNSVSLLGAGDIVLAATPSGVAGAIQFSNGSAFASDAANLFWDDTNKRLGIGTNAPTSALHNTGVSRFGSVIIGQAAVTAISSTAQNVAINLSNGSVGIGGFTTFTPSARVHIQGSGSTSATTSLLVQNSGGGQLLSIADSGLSIFNGTVQNTTGPMQALFFATSSSPFNFGTASIYNITGTTPVVTSGQRDGFLGQFTFAPTSGTAILNVLNASPTINQTGGANGITRGLYINPTLTAAADFRAIEVSNGGAYINTTSVQASAILQADSTTKGFLPPRMTTTQKNAIATPASGLILYDSTTNKLQCYNGSTWNDLF
jgi:hypothetical protein